MTMPAVAAAAQVARYFAANRAFHAPWDPPRPEVFYTAAFWQKRLAENCEELRQDRAARFFIMRRDDPARRIIGCCNFTAFIRGPFQCCNLGFSLDEQQQGKGYMTEALRATIAYVFETLRLHRIQANHLPHNVRSRDLLRRLGFVVEGYARDYLFIADAWQDHVLTALTNPDPQPPR